MNFPFLAYFMLFVDSSTENQFNIIFVCIVADDNINYLRNFIMLNRKEDGILLYNCHVPKSYSDKNWLTSFHKKDGVCAVWIIFLKNCEKPAQQIDSWAVAHLAHHVLFWYSQWSDAQSGGCTRDTQNYPSDRQGNWHFAEVSGMHHTQRHSAKAPEETIEAWSGIQDSIARIGPQRQRLAVGLP